MSEIDNGVLHREFSVDLETSGDGRTVDVRIVPFNVAQRVIDPPPFGTGVPYEEVWLPGAFDKQTDVAHRIDVLANFEHEQGIGGVVGKGTELRDTGDALEGTFRMLNGSDGDKMLELVESGYVKGVSLEARPTKVRSGRRPGKARQGAPHQRRVLPYAGVPTGRSPGGAHGSRATAELQPRSLRASGAHRLRAAHPKGDREKALGRLRFAVR